TDMVQGPLHSALALFLVQCMFIILLSRCIGWLFGKIQQPSVIAEIISGIILGPTAMGQIPNFSATLFPKESVDILSVFAQVGLIFFMFIIGLELDPTLFRSQIKKSSIIAMVSIIFPFGLGLAASVYLAHIQSTRWTYSLGIFIGVALCITAFPVLARILTAKKLLSTPIGILTIACAAINDICGWILLGLSVSLAGSSNSLGTVWTLLAAAGFVAVMLVIIRPVLNKVLGLFWHVDPNASTGSHPPSPSHLVMNGVVFLLFAASWSTEVIGIHAMFGAFTLGSITPKTGGFNQAITEKIEDLILVFLLPLYFVVSGLRTDLTTLNTGDAWIGVLLIISCACVGKIVGSGVTAFLLGSTKRDALSIGILMNTRGLVELIVLNLGLDFGIISTKVFGIMVLMAVFTTLLTSPLISLVMKKERPKDGTEDFTVVLCTPSLKIGPSLVDLGYTIGNKTVRTVRRKKMKKVYLLSVSEVNDRPSDFIGQIRRDFSRSSYSHLIHQGAAMKLKVSYHSIVSDNDHLSKEIISFSNNKKADLLIVGRDTGNMIQGRGGMINQGVQWSIFKNAVTHIGVFTDRSGFKNAPHRFRRILLSYMGGSNPNDAEALDLAIRMSETDGVHVTIVVFDSRLYARYRKQQSEKQLMAAVVDPNSNNNIQSNPLNSSMSPDGGGPTTDNINNTDNINSTNTSTNTNNVLATSRPQVNFNEPNTLAGTTESLSRTTELLALDPMYKDEHLERVMDGKSVDKVAAIYKPKRHRLRVIMDMCVHYDLLVVPHEERKKKSTTTSPFPGIDRMRRSFGLRRVNETNDQQQHLDQQYDEEPITIELPSAIHVGEPTSIHYSPPLQSDHDHDINIPLEERTMPTTDDSPPSDLTPPPLPSSNDYDGQDFWSNCPISTLIIYRKPTTATTAAAQDNTPYSDLQEVSIPPPSSSGNETTNQGQ
ncbi:hypothetical protein SAMD00019534_085650, partial [Acytostelium subglobosum LB1]|uniref:hypothetical protein n=1 Tax=Acytostelium subglobosum LB1 TaxID=1410327 RepID=UPI000644A95F